jgi:hypothetical protein
MHSTAHIKWPTCCSYDSASHKRRLNKYERRSLTWTLPFAAVRRGMGAWPTWRATSAQGMANLAVKAGYGDGAAVAPTRLVAVASAFVRS